MYAFLHTELHSCPKENGVPYFEARIMPCAHGRMHQNKEKIDIFFAQSERYFIRFKKKNVIDKLAEIGIYNNELGKIREVSTV